MLVKFTNSNVTVSELIEKIYGGTCPYNLEQKIKRYLDTDKAIALLANIIVEQCQVSYDPYKHSDITPNEYCKSITNLVEEFQAHLKGAVADLQRDLQEHKNKMENND